MPEQYSPNKKRASAAEAAAGAGIGVAAASGQVPDIVNRWALRAKRGEYERIKERMKYNDMPNTKYTDVARTKVVTPDMSRGAGYDKKTKKWVELKDLPESESKPVIRVDREGKEHPGTEKTTPRKDAYNAAIEEHNKAKNLAHDRVNVPFPDAPYEYNEKGKRLKKVPKRDPATGTPIKTAKGKIKMIRSPAAVGEGRRVALMGVGIPLGLAVAWHGARNMAHQNDLKRAEVGKAMTRSEMDGAIVGGSIGGVLYQAPSFTEWGGRSKEDKALMKKKKTKKIVREWKEKYGVKGAIKGDENRWTEAYRHYPRSLPGSEMRRVQAYTHAGRSGLVLTGGAVLAGGAIGAHAVKTTRNRRARKAANSANH